MATKKTGSNWMQKTKVKLKILAPIGLHLSPSETIVLAEMYDNDVKVIDKNNDELQKALVATRDSTTIAEGLAEASAARNKAAGTYKMTKDPIKKREWARRVVVADQTVQTMRDVKMRMDNTRDRLTMIKGDLELQLMEAEAKAQEMHAYAQAGKGLRLVGERLIQARNRASNLKLEYDNLEVTMEGAEKLINGLAPDELLNKADEIVGNRDER